MSEKKRTQLTYILIAFIASAFASIDYLPKYGFEFYPFGAIFMLAWIAITSYAILKHQLMDIKVIFKQSLVYTIIIAAISLFYILCVVLFEQAFRNILGYRTLGGSIFASVIIAAFFIPFRMRVQDFVDKRLFKGTPSQLAETNKLLLEKVVESEKLKSSSTLASGIAHEIKNPLTAIQTFSEYLPQKMDDKKFLAKFSRIVGHEVQRIDNLVHQLLEYAKPAPLNLKGTPIHDLINETSEVMNNQLLKRKIKLVKDFQAPAGLSLHIDHAKIKQVLLNLILNAIDVMPNGGILTISTEVADKGKSFRLSVTDTGPGIAKDDLPHIFEPFFSKKDKGTGLGLSICQSILKEHSAKLTAGNAKNGGAWFEMKFSSLKSGIGDDGQGLVND